MQTKSCLSLTMLLLMLAGCAQKESAQPAEATTSAAAGTASPSTSALTPATTAASSSPTTAATTASHGIQVQYGLLDPATTRASIVNYSVSTNAPLSVTLNLGNKTVASKVVTSRDRFPIALDFGHEELRVRLTAPGFDRYDNVTLTRLAWTRLVVDYGLKHPSGPKVDTYDVWVDVDARASKPLYDEKKAARPDKFTVHDQLHSWSVETAIDYRANHSASLQGFFLETIDGVGYSNPYSGFWELRVNETSSDQGMSLKTLAPGDRVQWRLLGL